VWFSGSTWLWVKFKAETMLQGCESTFSDAAVQLWILLIQTGYIFGEPQVSRLPQGWPKRALAQETSMRNPAI
jgi:hypothetical protein